MRLDEELLRAAKQLATSSGRSPTALIEDTLREAILRRDPGVAPAHEIAIPTFCGRGPRAGVDLDNSAALLDAMDQPE